MNCSAVDHAGNTSHSTFNVIVSYGFGGFYRPVDNLPTVNVVKAGSAIPVKFSLGGDQGLNVFASGYPASVNDVCSAQRRMRSRKRSPPVAAASAMTRQRPVQLRLEDRQELGGHCRQLQVKLRDGSSRWAAFNFTR